MTVQRALVVSSLVVMALAGCAGQDPPTERIVVCWGSQDPPPGDGSVLYRFVQDGQDVAQVSAEVDIAVGVDVPAGKRTTVLADDRPFGEVGVESDEPTDAQASGYTAIMGQGCPNPASLGVAPSAS